MVTPSRSSCNRSRRSHPTLGRGFCRYLSSSRQSFLNTLGNTLSWATAPIIEENNPRFFAGHVGVDGGDAGLAQRLKCRSQLIFSDGEVAIDYDVLIRTGKCRPSVHPIVLSRSTLWTFGRMSEGELDHSLFGDKHPVGNMILRRRRQLVLCDRVILRRKNKSDSSAAVKLACCRG
jgi:hypothetical protein